MIKKVRETIKKYHMLERGDMVIVAVSGGPDSVALLKALDIFSDEYRLTIITAHLNHGLRGEESNNDEKFVRKLSESMGIEFECKYVDIPSLRQGRGRSIEEIAREERYQFLAEMARKHQAHKIALGHHLYDQAETVLMNFIRGSGMEGLKGILPVREGMYIRPLIAVTRGEIVGFLEKEGIRFVIDSSNTHDLYFRNRIRHHLIPELKEHYNPKIEESLAHMAEIIRLEDEYMKTSLKEVLSGWEVGEGNGEEVRINIPEFFVLHEAVQNRAIKTLLQRFSPSGGGIGYVHVKSVTDLLRSGCPHGCLHLPFNIKVRREYDLLVISRRKRSEGKLMRELSGDYDLCFSSPDADIGRFSYDVAIPGRVEILELGMTMVFDIVDKPLNGIYFNGEKIAYMDLEAIKFPLVIRNLRPGDRIQPLGMEGTKNLKCYFIDEKIPQCERRRIPLLVDDQSVLWIGGMRLSERVKITDKTRRVVKVEIV
ncbi:MAG: tRNA lysidine(34) synthetase TilS [Syntrophales bacterium]|nr:tRNA lysidine(34) synthetase TilS [Syntrophales bacterium]